MNRTSIRLLVVAVSIGLAVILEAQEDQRFRANTDLVSIYATITDEDGRLIPNLAKSDFTVYDNGKAQPLTAFSNDLQPFSAVIMLDRSGSQAATFSLVQSASVAFVRQFLPADRARVGSFSAKILLSPEEFTSNREELTSILRNQLQEAGPSPVWAAIDRSISSLVSETRQRRVVLVFTDGHDERMYGQPNIRLSDIMRRLRVDDVMIYAVGLDATFSAQRPSPNGGYGGYSAPGPFGRPPISSRSVEPPDPALKDMAEESGGGYIEIVPGQDVVTAFARVAEELHRQYWLGFAPPSLDGKTHKIDVKVRRPNAKVRARKNYIAGGAD